ncbi:pyruvate oxidase [Ligilactobacillus salitolerans]|uniref:Pyruvate oxidase n=1 Tax=Ligilactobacillus salitolerans TaxID=1808352 RepID=A0A401IRN6_9LACO|nr:pyruvate oxidase [Ligilactobacillus salitolerans]GBG94165.1 pyruvate oxidase [Ligilactobacillus salitolerans]
MKNGADRIVDVLTAWGVDHVYGIPGDSIDTTVDGIRRQADKVKFIQVRHEEVGALAAAAEAKLTDKLAVCLSIGGPGAIHMLNGLYDAKMDHAPVLALLGQVDSHLLNTGYFQEVNTPHLFEDVAVYNRSITSVDHLAEIVDEAIQTAYSKHGVAVLTIPDDIPQQKVAAAFQPSAVPFQTTIPTVPADKVAAAVDLLNRAKAPVVLFGTGIKHASQTMQKFVEYYKLPFIQTLPAKGIIPDDHPNSLGQVGKLGTKAAYRAMQNADLLLLIGTNYPYTAYLPKPGRVKSIQINLEASHLNKRYPADIAIQGDAGAVVEEILNSSLQPTDGKFLKDSQAAMATWNGWVKAKTELKGSPLAPEVLFNEIKNIAAKDAVFAIDVGTATSWSARYLPVGPRQSYTISSWLGTMGCALPAAIAACQVYPERQVISINGDGAFAMVMEDFVTAVKYRMPLINIVLNNEKLAFIGYEQQSAGQLNYAIDLADMDYAKFAEAAGGIGITVTNKQELASALKKAAQSKDKPVLINAYVADDAPLPGQIVLDEAKGYTKFGTQFLAKYKKMPKLPPIKDIMRHFF